MRIVVLFIAYGLLGSTSWGGTITGTVKAEGKAGTTEATGGGGGAYAGRKFKFVERIDYTALQDFVVYIEGPLQSTNVHPRLTNAPVLVETKRNITQRGARFTPGVLPVMVGTTVEWPNRDEIFHNVFSISDAKQFDLGLYKDPEVKRITFDQTGRVDAFCSIHKTMHCVILVLENPFFATADDQGRFRISDVPAGRYKLKAWHERLPSKSQEIVVPETGEVTAQFVLGITGLPQY